VESERVEDHVMHSERYHVTREAADAVNGRKGRLVCVGTTSLRVAESQFSQWGQMQPGDFSTDIFITPGYRFKACDILVTNFHLPRSTLLMLVAAFVGMEQMRKIYAVAVDEKYRFYSFGDATWLERRTE
jgi:S-adenosylmethionine:tRNA ribosyltransferase-isomerase